MEPDIGRMLRELQEQGPSRLSSSEESTEVRELMDPENWKGGSRTYAGRGDVGKWLTEPSRRQKGKSLY